MLCSQSTCLVHTCPLMTPKYSHENKEKKKTLMIEQDDVMMTMVIFCLYVCLLV